MTTTKYIIFAVDNNTDKPVYAQTSKVFRGTVTFARSGGYCVDRQDGEDNPFAFYNLADATHFTADEVATYWRQLVNERAQNGEDKFWARGPLIGTVEVDDEPAVAQTA